MIQDELKWFENLRKSPKYIELKQRPIAYFCAEYAISSELPTYAGGLGIFAGDYVREAIDQKIPLLCVGLYYREGFTCKQISSDGKIVEVCTVLRPEDAGMLPVVTLDQKEVKIAVPIQDHIVYLRAWKWEKGEVKIYLLDSHLPENSEADQHIADKLYGADREIRLKQEIILGIGGLRLVEVLGHHPSHYHLNEGHSAFLIYELIHHEMATHNLSFEEAKGLVRERVLFTNHTLVAAGNDTFSNDLVALLLTRYAREIEIPVKDLVDMGLVQQSSTFSMTILAMRAAGKINAVSRLHAKKAQEIWADHPMFPITNGIHVPTWDRVGEVEKIWENHQENKKRLLSTIRSQTGEEWEENTLLLGWARRIVRYKRPLAMVERLKRFLDMANNKERPVRLVYAGIAHPADEDGIEQLAELQYRLQMDLKGLAVYLPNYNMELAKQMIAGCDMWVNTPVVGFEACGTSGMKAALNGVLPLTTRDGWVDEVNLYKIGWNLDDANVTDEILERLEHEILPMYYTRDEQGKPNSWIELMKNARSLVENDFSMTRALRQYLEEGLGVTAP
jgi:starch phosphorylase